MLLVSLARPSRACLLPPQDRRHALPIPSIRVDQRRVSETFCRIGAGFRGQSAHLARNSAPFHPCSWRISPGILHLQSLPSATYRATASHCRTSLFRFALRPATSLARRQGRYQAAEFMQLECMVMQHDAGTLAPLGPGAKPRAAAPRGGRCRRAAAPDRPPWPAPAAWTWLWAVWSYHRAQRRQEPRQGRRAVGPPHGH